MTLVIDPRHIWNVQYNARGNRSHPPTYFKIRAKSPSIASVQIKTIRRWSEPDPGRIRPWNRLMYLSHLGEAFCKIWRSGYLPKFCEMVHLPWKVTLQHYQILRLLQKNDADDWSSSHMKRPVQCADLFSTLLHSTLLCSTLLFSSILCSTLLFSAILYSTLYSTLLYPTLLYSVLYSNLFCTLLFSSILYSTFLSSTFLYSTLLSSPLLSSPLLYSTLTLLYPTLHYSTLLYTTLLYSTLFYSILSLLYSLLSTLYSSLFTILYSTILSHF